MGLRAFCYKLYWRAQSFIIPNFQLPESLYEETISQYAPNGGNWLDLGCGHHLLPPWRIRQEEELVHRACQVVGLDYEYGSLRNHATIRTLVRGDVSTLPFGDGTFDLVTANMVFEHLRSPHDQLREIRRILRPGGILVFHTPNADGYGVAIAKLIPNILKKKLILFLQERSEEDVFPAYYRINTSRAIHSIAESVGFRVLRLQFRMWGAQTIVIPPLAILELLIVRLLMMHTCRRIRTNIVACLQRP